MEKRDYTSLSHDELVRLLEARDRQTKFGLVWERPAAGGSIEQDHALNSDFVALDFDASLSAGDAPYQNLIIEGDNFDALRHLKMCYSGQVKCIYIDPPYNTGNKDFVYNDRFIDANDLWRHSTWVEFMYQRLTLAKELLRQDGVIFVSIDDNEVAPLRLLMDKIFGQNNFVATFIWRKVDSPNDNKVPITPDHESIVCFALSKNSTDFRQMEAPHIVSAYGSTDENGRRYRDRLLKKNGKNSLRKDRPTMFFPLTAPDKSKVFPIHDNGEEARWAMGKEGIEKHQDSNTLIWKEKTKLDKKVWEPYTREYAPENPTRPYPTIWTDLPTMRQAKAMLREIFNSSDLFSTPKPIELIERILRIATQPNDIVLDFFAGSGTTGHAVLKMNKEDGGNRKFILVSNTEATPDNPDKNLCRDICAERIRRVINGYNDVEGLGGNFAYLRCRRVAPAELLDIDHAEVWHSLSLMHLGSLTPYRPKHGFMWAGDEISAVAYVPRYSDELLPALRAAVQTTGEATIYSWQPEMLKTRVRSPRASHQGIPDTLARRFGLGRG